MSREDVLGAAQRVLNVDATASIAEIAQAAGVSRATMHRYFASRDAMLVELGTRSLDRWESRMDVADLDTVAAAEDAAQIHALLETLVRQYVDDADEFGFALTDHVVAADEALAARCEVLADREAVFWAAAQRAGVLRPELPPRWIGHAVYGLLVSGREAVRIGDVARRDVASLVLKSLLHGVSAS